MTLFPCGIQFNIEFLLRYSIWTKLFNEIYKPNFRFVQTYSESSQNIFVNYKSCTNFLSLLYTSYFFLNDIHFLNIFDWFLDSSYDIFYFKSSAILWKTQDTRRNTSFRKYINCSINEMSLMLQFGLWWLSSAQRREVALTGAATSV